MNGVEVSTQAGIASLSNGLFLCGGMFCEWESVLAKVMSAKAWGSQIYWRFCISAR